MTHCFILQEILVHMKCVSGPIGQPNDEPVPCIYYFACFNSGQYHVPISYTGLRGTSALHSTASLAVQFSPKKSSRDHKSPDLP